MRYYDTLAAASAARTIEYGDAAAPLSYWMLAFAGEVGEACNIVKKFERERMGMPGSRATIDDLAEELSDAAIYLQKIRDHVREHYGINLDRSTALKFNKTSEELGMETRLTVPE